ncbi:MAG: hypothetical protein AB3N11_00275 [Arenibacterium sp.]
MNRSQTLRLRLGMQPQSSRRAPLRATAVGWLAFAGRTPTLMALALLWPGTARAEVCDKERPFWDSANGPATAIDEALHLAASPLAIALLVATALAIRFKSSWGGLIVVCGWSALVGLVTYLGSTDPDVEQAALAEGCIGSPALFIAAVAAISVATIIYTSPRKSRAD